MSDAVRSGPPEPRLERDTVVRSLIASLVKQRIEHCVIRGFPVESGLSGDLDLLVRPADFGAIGAVFFDCCEDLGLFVLEAAVVTKSLYLRAVSVENPSTKRG